MEYTDFFVKVQTHLDNELPLVLFKKPNEVKICGLLQQESTLHVSSQFDKNGFVFSPFAEGQHKTVWMYLDECERIETNFQKNIAKEAKSVFKQEKALNAKNKHLNIVENAIKKLQLGEFQKIVISRSELHNVQEMNSLLWFENMCDLYPNTFCYYWHHPKVGTWMGATPETLISLSKNHFQTMALAGTMPFNGTEDVIWGGKEKEEQQMVVDSIMNELTPVSKHIEIGDTVTQKAGNLLHLKTTISGELNTLNGIKVLVEELHPTPAVCGLPKEKSKMFILGNESYDRSYYTGYLGSFSQKGNTNLFVNLRCMQLHQQKVEIYVGGGITALSNAEAEWEETVNKSQIMKAIF